AAGGRRAVPAALFAELRGPRGRPTSPPHQDPDTEPLAERPADGAAEATEGGIDPRGDDLGRCRPTWRRRRRICSRRRYPPESVARDRLQRNRPGRKRYLERPGRAGRDETLDQRLELRIGERSQSIEDPGAGGVPEDLAP